MNAVLVEEQGGKGADAQDVAGVVFVRGGVHLGDNDLVVSGEGLGDLLVLGVEALAVAAPGGVDHDEDVLVLVAGDGGVGFTGEFDDAGHGEGNGDDGEDSEESEGAHFLRELESFILRSV